MLGNLEINGTDSKAFEVFKEMYPRISTGSPRDPWRAVKGDKIKKTSLELEPLNPPNFEAQNSEDHADGNMDAASTSIFTEIGPTSQLST